jgi:FlaA1/EpsC-like NDP-sugar epimerase
MTLLLLYLSDLYNFQLQLDKGELILRVGLASAIAAVLTAALGYAVPSLRFGRMAFLASTALSSLGLMAFRLMTRHLVSHQLLQKRVLVLGTDLADIGLGYSFIGHHVRYRARRRCPNDNTWEYTARFSGRSA